MSSGTKVFINESLCDYYKLLWSKCKISFLGKNIASFWVTNERVKKVIKWSSYYSWSASVGINLWRLLALTETNKLLNCPIVYAEIPLGRDSFSCGDQSVGKQWGLIDWFLYGAPYSIEGFLMNLWEWFNNNLCQDL